MNADTSAIMKDIPSLHRVLEFRRADIVIGSLDWHAMLNVGGGPSTYILRKSS